MICSMVLYLIASYHNFYLIVVWYVSFHVGIVSSYTVLHDTMTESGLLGFAESFGGSLRSWAHLGLQRSHLGGSSWRLMDFV